MLRRIVPASAAAALLVTGLAACSPAATGSDDCAVPLASGVLSDSVTVLGSFGEAPQVSLPEGAEIVTSQRTVVSTPEEADADAVRADSDTLVGVNMALFDGETSEEIYQSAGFAGAGSPEFLLLTEEAVSPLSEAVRCSVAGERVVVGIAPAEAEALMAQLGASQNASLVGVIDVVSVSTLSASTAPGASAARGLPAGFPAVVTDETGRPGVVLPPNDAPAGVTSAVRIAGTGDEVTASDNVVAQVLEVGWDGSEISNSWTTGPVGLGSEEQIAQSGFTYRADLTGQRVGSQTVIIDNGRDGPATVRVVDILGVA